MANQLAILNNIRQLRQQQGAMTQSELGKVIGVTRQTVAAIEQRRYSPSLEIAFKIARHFGVGIEDVFIWDQPAIK